MLDSVLSFLYKVSMSVKETSGIRERRIAKGLSQEELAALVGCSRQSISLYESGLQQPGVLIARKLADAFGCSLDELYPSGRAA